MGRQTKLFFCLFIKKGKHSSNEERKKKKEMIIKCVKSRLVFNKKRS